MLLFQRLGAAPGADSPDHALAGGIAAVVVSGVLDRSSDGVPVLANEEPLWVGYGNKGVHHKLQGALTQPYTAEQGLVPSQAEDFVL